MTLESAVMVVASFLGAYLGQRHAGARLAADLRALAVRVKRLEDRTRWGLGYLGALHRRVLEVERTRGAP